MLAGDSALHPRREPLRPFDPQESGWADIIRTDMDSWFPDRLPIHFNRSTQGALRGGLAGPAPFALVGALFALAAAAALLGRRGKRRGRGYARSAGGRGWPAIRRAVGPRSWGGS
ncbi:hypothetical protein [Candidatus Nephthysia bennettiae]|uniref:Uncharacterized protein n=1 Tax=Candidatus Nephthysia bennettiae TaxID=3127016 RepID=A0A934N1Y7_9BACT|nr:hypothetical protein [Candidatus Dormibacteraeota bacterium]MBJ7610992.1 hypothetical protein [Candidatus Dormibacteraeota bacterium]